MPQKSFKNAHIALMNSAPGPNHVTLQFTKEARYEPHYRQVIWGNLQSAPSQQLRFKSLMLVADRKLYLDPGCSGAIPSGLVLVEGEDLFIFPDRDHLVQDGLIIEVHPVRVGEHIFTSVFNMSNEQKKIKEGEVYSILSYVGVEVAEWSLV